MHRASSGRLQPFIIITRVQLLYDQKGAFMDRRIQRTRNSLFSAFIELRATKPVEKITVKELTEKANISKQTFYLHFQDIYDLSEYLEMMLFCPSSVTFQIPNICLLIRQKQADSCAMHLSIRDICSPYSFLMTIEATES